MALFTRIENLFQPVTDIDAQRHALRVSTSIPATYVTADDAKAQVRQSTIVNISRDGVAIEVVDLPTEARKRITKPGTQLRLKAYLRAGEGILAFPGVVRWSTSQDGLDHVGVQFTDIDVSTKVILVSQALRGRKRRYAFGLGIVVLLLVSLASVLVAYNARRTINDLRQKLVESETDRFELRKEIKALKRTR